VRRGGQLLAVATKNNILLYETPKGERAFRFVKVGLFFVAEYDLSLISHFRNSTHHYNRGKLHFSNNLSRTYYALQVVYA
jgi:hypothetical protein